MNVFDYEENFEMIEVASYGMLFTAEVKTLGELPEDMEMAEIIFCDKLPDKLTYPLIQPKLLEYIARKNP